ncbi:glycosyltransferase [Glaciihabitans arcticus]|uniref:Glycosyltransferase n=1 Tax=Glaciihabitans arcticus TaxID=2668039 RepID=A0A4Q9GTR9_9MICO|nr:glycosyltransferase [Glaciihabitans arcticus]TBN55953.1 glycosyltransferase [Glaciihabitans arcticus]
MRIALTTNVLLVPPTYFAVNHALRLADRHEFEMFALLADVRDAAITIPVHDYAAGRGLPRQRRMFFAPFAGPAMRRGIERFGADVIHQHFATWSGPAIAASRHGGTPLLTTLHGYDVRVLAHAGGGPMNAWHRRNVRAMQAASTRVLAVSRYLADEAIAVGFDPARLQVHYQGIDTDYFTPGGSAPSGSPLISFVGALNEQKGPRDLVAASLAVVGRFEHRLRLIGSGPLEAELRALAADHPHIEVLGGVPRETVRATLRESLTMVLPTQAHNGGREAAGLVLLEAQACGTPVIAYNSGGVSEMLVDGVTGELVPESSVDGLTSAVAAMLALSAPERATLGVAARDFVVRERSLALSCAELEQHYTELVGL